MIVVPPGKNLEPLHPPNVPDEGKELERKFIFQVPKIQRLQAWLRAALSRRKYPHAPSLSPQMIIKYISAQMKPSLETVRLCQERLGPFQLSWDLAAQQKTLVLHKPQTDAEGTYCGYWNLKPREKQGYGQLLTSAGEKYEGFWLHSQFEGQGRYIYENGDCYTGEWRQGKAEGQGVLVTASGTTYRGEWKSSLRHGRGKPFV
jgi:hypothetical protein